MKKPFIASLIGILLMSGCITDKKEKPQKIENNTVEVKKETTKKEQEIPTEIESAVNEFYQAHIDKDYEKIASLYSKKTLKSLNYDEKAVAKWTNENFDANQINVQKHEIITFKDYDSNHKYIQVDKYYLFGTEQSPAIEKDEWMLVKEDNKWNFDSTFVILSKKLDLPELTVVKDVVSFSNFVLEERVDGLAINATIKNLSTDKNLSLEKGTTLTILTDKGSFLSDGLMDKVSIPATGEGNIYLPFKWSEGVPTEIKINNIFYVDENGKQTGEKFDVTISLLKN